MRVLPALQALEEGRLGGAHSGYQVYVSLGGSTLLDHAAGYARPGVPMGTDSLLIWLSATKPLVALALARYWEEGRLDLQAPVAAYLPRFGQAGKAGVTVWQVLTHTGGFRSRVDLEWQTGSWHEMVDLVCAAPLERDWVPGTRAAYHAASGWIVLGELLRVLGGRSCAEVLRDEVLLPLGMADSWVGMPAEVYRQLAGRLAGLFNTQTEPRLLANWEGEAQAARCLPWAGGRGPMRDLGRFYEVLLRGGAPLVAPATVAHFTSRQRQGLFDQTFGRTIDWGLGFVLDSKQHGADVPYGYGAYASSGAFGHSGRQCCVAFADPAHRLVVAAGFNGMPGEGRHDRRVRSFLDQLYRDLGLV